MMTLCCVINFSVFDYHMSTVIVENVDEQISCDEQVLKKVIRQNLAETV